MEMMDDHGGFDSGPSRPAEEEGAPTWMVTFGDMMSLLLTFFILLYSMSELREERFVLASQSLREAMGSTAPTPPLDPQSLLEETDPEDLVPSVSGSADAEEVAVPSEDALDVFTEAYMRMIAERLKRLTAERGLDERTVEVVTLDDGVYLRIRDAVLFGSGNATLTYDGRAIIESLADITASLEVPTVVAGHADDRAIATMRYPSNWELSAARAAGVARFLVAGGQDPTTVQVHSHGEHAPIAENSTAEGRARNRRVELYFSREEIRKAAARLLGGSALVEGLGDVVGGV